MTRAKLLKSYKHPNKSKAWAVGTVVQGTSRWISELIHDGYAVKYDGEYPPKEKLKINLSNLKTK